jgi:hypothetical protein
MPGTGPLRRSSVLARKKAIVGKSLVEAERLQRPAVVFVSDGLHGLKLLLLGKLGRGQVAQGAMRPALIILDSPLFDNDAGFQQRAKDFPIQTFIAQLVMEALDEGLLPRRPWLDVDGFDVVIGHPISDSVSDELRAVVAAQMFGQSVAVDRCLDHGDGIDGPDGPGDMGCQRLLGVLVDEGQDSKRRTHLGLIVHDIPAPHFIAMLSSLALPGRDSNPLHPSLFFTHLEPFPATHPLHPLSIDPLSPTAKQRGHPPVSITRMLLAQINNLSLHLSPFFTRLACSIQARACQSYCSAGLGGASQAFSYNVLHCPSPA